MRSEAIMRSAEVALRLSIVLSVAAFIALVASLYEIDRREKSSADTAAANLAEIERHLQVIDNQIRVLSGQYAAQLSAQERRLQALGSQLDTLRQQYNSRLKALEDDLRVLRVEQGPARR
jgi:chromosome segregation ATPase